MAGRLCCADLGGIATRQGDVYRFAATFGQSPNFDAVLRQQSHSPGRGASARKDLHSVGVEAGVHPIPV